MRTQEVREYIDLIVMQLNNIIDNLLIKDTNKWLLFTQEASQQLGVCQDMIDGARGALVNAKDEQ